MAVHPTLDGPATFRMTRAEREQLRREAAEAGISLQQLFELRMLGGIRPPRGKPGRPRKARQGEALDLGMSA